MWTTRRLVARSRELFNSEYVSADVNRANRHKWVRAVQRLGDSWVYWDTYDIGKKGKKKNESSRNRGRTALVAVGGNPRRNGVRPDDLGVV